MGEYWFPWDARTLLRALRGREIVAVRRQVLLSDYNELDEAVRDEEADGPTELLLDDGTALHFIPDTEQMSVKVGVGGMPAWGDCFRVIEPSENQFWAPRIGRQVAEVYVLVSKYAEQNNRSEFAVELRLVGGGRVVLEYISDEAHPDMLRITGEEPAGDYRRLKLA